MWDRLSPPWQASAEMAWEACCCGCVPIGAVITDPAGNLVAAGRNRMYEPRSAGALHISGVPLAHAEINALLALDYDAVNARQCTLYTTTEPCPQCAGALVMCNVRHLCYASRDPWAGAVNLFQISPYMASKNTRVEGPPDPLFEAVLIALQAEYMVRESARRGKSAPLARPDPVLDAMEKAVPQGVALGERLYRERSLQAMREEHLPARQVFDLLAGMLAPLGGSAVIVPQMAQQPSLPDAAE